MREEATFYAYDEMEKGEWLPELQEKGWAIKYVDGKRVEQDALSPEFANAILDFGPTEGIEVVCEFDGDKITVTEMRLHGKKFTPSEVSQ
jgi:hypothetical protein